MSDRDFQIGNRVRVRPERLDDFFVAVQRKLRDRIGEVRAHQPFSGAPIVMFEAVGRRKRMQWVPPQGGSYLELAE